MSRRYISSAIKKRVVDRARHRCGYCLAHEKWLYHNLRIDHIIPLAAGGTNDESNLWTSCDSCNGYKSDKTSEIDPETDTVVPLFNPFTQAWSEHFALGEDKATMNGITPTGRATVKALKMNEPHLLEVRRNWVIFGCYPPED